MFSRVLLVVVALVAAAPAPGDQDSTQSKQTEQHTAERNNNNDQRENRKQERTASELAERQKKIEAGRAAVQKALQDFEAHNSHFRALVGNETQLNEIAEGISARVTPKLSQDERKALDNSYAESLHHLQTQNMSQADAANAVAHLAKTAEDAAVKLHDADREDARATRKAFRSARRSEFEHARDLHKKVREALKDMGGATSLEELEHRAGYSERQYDRDEDALGDEKDRFSDRAGDLADRTDDLIEDTYSKVEHRVETRVHTLEEDARKRHHQQRDALREARTKLNWNDSLDRVDQKLGRLEQQVQSSGSVAQQLVGFQGINSVCAAIVAVSAALAVFAVMMKRQAERQSIHQPELFA